MFHAHVVESELLAADGKGLDRSGNEDGAEIDVGLKKGAIISKHKWLMNVIMGANPPALSVTNPPGKARFASHRSLRSNLFF
jgi:hypothetical protein